MKKAIRAPTLLMVNGRQDATYESLHAAFSAQRNPQSGAILIYNGTPMCRCIGAMWELTPAGISELAFEYEQRA